MFGIFLFSDTILSVRQAQEDFPTFDATFLAIWGKFRGKGIIVDNEPNNFRIIQRRVHFLITITCPVPSDGTAVESSRHYSAYNELVVIVGGEGKGIINHFMNHQPWRKNYSMTAFDILFTLKW